VCQLEGFAAKDGCRPRLGLQVSTTSCLRPRPSGHGGLKDSQHVSCLSEMLPAAVDDGDRRDNNIE
jgi:hypothetical protein